jgi:hypothetical protein
MPNAAAKVQEERKGEANQYELADPRRDRALYDCIGVWPRRGRKQSHNQGNGRETYDEPGDAICDRED